MITAEVKIAAAVGTLLRDEGFVRFCPECRLAFMPGTLRCSRCQGITIRPRKINRIETASMVGAAQTQAEETA